jgi:hypothetical protein
MAQVTQKVGDNISSNGSGTLFGIPLGDLGLFATLLMSFAAGFGAFFVSTFLAIMGMLFYGVAVHHQPDYGITYRSIGLPVGLFVLCLALGYLGTQWVRRKVRGA